MDPRHYELNGRPSPLVLLSVLSLVATSVLAAQTVKGVVLDDQTRGPVTNAAITLIDGSGFLVSSTITDSTGSFVFSAGVGTYSLRVDALGYATTESVSFGVESGQRVELELLVSQEAVRLGKVTVSADAEPFAPGPLRGFHDRRRRGVGRFLTREQIEQQVVDRFTSLLQLMPGVQVVRMAPDGGALGRIRHYTVRVGARTCPPLLYLDGVKLGSIDDASALGPDRLLFPSELEAIEVYRPSEIPAEFSAGESGCGLVVVWTQRAPDGVVAAGIPSVWSGGTGAELAGFDRSVFELSWRPATGSGHGILPRIRAGTYTPSEFLGRARSQSDGFDQGTRPFYASVYVGVMRPVPGVASMGPFYSRLAGGFTFYGGEASLRTQSGDSVVVLEPSVAPRLGWGGEVAVGLRIPAGTLRPWVEVGLGTEYVARAGMRFVRPSVLVGLEVGRIPK